MEHFKAGDRVVAVNTDMSRALSPPAHEERHAYSFPDGVLRRDVVYYVESVSGKPAGSSLYLTGMRVFWGPKQIPWCSTRFRKVDALKGHVPKKRKRREPAAKKRVLTKPVKVTLVRRG